MEEEKILLMFIAILFVVGHLIYKRRSAARIEQKYMKAREFMGASELFDVYEDEEFGFYFLFPQDWGLVDEYPNIKIAVLAPTKDDYIDNVRMDVSIDSAKPDLLRTSPELFESQYKQQYDNFKLINTEKGKIAGERCWIITFTATGVEDEKLCLTQYLFNHDKNLYRVTISNLEADFDKYDATLKDIVKSFVFK